MTHRPWPIILLAFLHFFEPLFKFIFYCIVFQAGPQRLLHAIIHQNPAWEVVAFFIFGPICAVAIYMTRKYSLAVFLVIQLYLMVDNVLKMKGFYEGGNLIMSGAIILIYITNIFIVTYILQPMVRIAYLDPKLRWWETSPRYRVHIPIILNNTLNVVVSNISRTGMLVKSESPLSIGDTVEFLLTYRWGGVDYKLTHKGQLVHFFEMDDHKALGIKFYDMTPEQRKVINGLIGVFEKYEFVRRPSRRNFKDFVDWLWTLNWKRLINPGSLKTT